MRTLRFADDVDEAIGLHGVARAMATYEAHIIEKADPAKAYKCTAWLRSLEPVD